MSAGGITGRLEGALRTLAAAESGHVAAAQLDAARAAAVQVGAELQAGMAGAGARDHFTRDALLAMDFGGLGARLAGEGSLAKGGVPMQAKAFLAAALLDSGASHAAADGTVALDLRALADATPPLAVPTGPIDAITATRLLGTSLAAPALASGRTDAEVFGMSVLGAPDAASVEAARRVEATLAAHRTPLADGAGPLGTTGTHEVSLGWSAHARATAEVVATGQEWDLGVRIADPADLAAPTGSIERLRGVGDRISQAHRSLLETWLPLQRGELRPSDPVVSGTLAQQARDLEEVAASPKLAALQAGIGPQRYGTPTLLEKTTQARTELATFSERLAAGDLRPNVPPLAGRVGDLLDRNIRDLLHGGTASADAGMAWTLEQVHDVVLSPVQHVDGLADLASDVLERAAVTLPRDLSFQHRGPLGQQLSGVLYRVQAAMAEGQVMSPAVRARLDAAIAELDEPFVRLGEGDRRIPISADAIMGMPITYLRQQRLEEIGRLASIVDGADLRAALDAELARPGVRGEFSGPEPYVDAFERVGVAVRMRTAPAVGRDADLLQRLLASSTVLRAQSGIDRAAVAAALTDRTPATRAAAVDAIMSVAQGAAADTAATITKLRAAAPPIAGDLDLAGRLRARSAAISSTLTPFGQTHDVRGIDRYVGNLIGIVDELDALPPYLQEFVPTAKAHALSELGRGLEAWTSATGRAGAPADVARLSNETLWPNRGRLGSLRASLDVVADIEQQVGAAPQSI